MNVLFQSCTIGFLSLEEIDEAEYGLAIPEPETVKQKSISKAGKNLRKDEHDNAGSCGDASGDGDDSSKKEMENTKTGKKGKKEKKRKKKKKVINETPTGEEFVAEDIGGSDSDGTETEVGDEMDDGDHLETQKKQQKKKKKRTMEIEESVTGQYYYHINFCGVNILGLCYVHLIISYLLCMIH